MNLRFLSVLFWLSQSMWSISNVSCFQFHSSILQHEHLYSILFSNIALFRRCVFSLHSIFGLNTRIELFFLLFLTKIFHLLWADQVKWDISNSKLCILFFICQCDPQVTFIHRYRNTSDILFAFFTASAICWFVYLLFILSIIWNYYRNANNSVVVANLVLPTRFELVMPPWKGGDLDRLSMGARMFGTPPWIWTKNYYLIRAVVWPVDDRGVYGTSDRNWTCTLSGLRVLNPLCLPFHHRGIWLQD